MLKFGSSGLLWMTKSLHVKYCITQTIIKASKLLNRPSLMNRMGKTIILEPIMVLATLVATLNEESVLKDLDALMDLIFSFFYLSDVCFSSLTYCICACVMTYYSSTFMYCCYLYVLYIFSIDLFIRMDSIFPIFYYLKNEMKHYDVFFWLIHSYLFISRVKSI